MATIVTVTLNPAVDRTLQVRDFRPGKVYRGKLLAFRAAGKGVNVSSVLAALGKPSVALGFVGLHEQSLFRAWLHPALVDCRLAPLPGVTRHHTTIIDPVNHTETHLREEGFRVSEADLRELRRSIGTVLRGGDFCVFSGSLPPGVEPRHLAALAAHCSQVGARVVVDAEGEVLRAVVGPRSRARLEFIAPNVAELARLTGKSLRTVKQVIEAARQVCNPKVASDGSTLRPRCKAVLASWGKRGAYLITPGEVWHARVNLPEDKAVNSVGCGDSLLAGFVAGLVDGASIEDCLRLAVGCAAADCTTYAAGEVDPDLAKTLAAEAQVSRIEETAPPRAKTRRRKAPRNGE